MNIDDNGEIRPELIERLKEHIPDSDWKQLENHLKEESKLGLLRKEILSKLEKQQRKIDQEWAQASVREKSEMIGEMQSKLYELQLVEHAAKKPLLEITKILISANPNRCVQRETNPAKLKPAKRRKNELGGLINNSNSAEDVNSALKRTSTREAKLYANSQVHLQHEERVISGIDEPEPKMVGPGRRGKRRGKSLVTTTTNGTISRAASPIPAFGEKEDEQQPNQGGEMMDEDDRADSINLAIPSPTIDEADCQSGMASANSPIRSPNGELGGGQESPTMTCMSSPTTTLGTRGARKRGRETAGSAMREVGIAGTLAIIGRSPRKRIATERHRNSSENIGTSHRGGGESVADEEEDRVPISVDEPTYCLCEQVSFGEMICCDNELCSVEWFHFACVSIKSKPKGKKWYCPLCRHNEKPNQLKPELQQKLEQMKKAQGQ